MLKPTRPRARIARASQQGMVLLVALVVLVAIMIGGIAMIRSVDTATLVAGNMAFEQSATHAADIGVEKAIIMLQVKLNDGNGGAALSSPDPTSGYFAQTRAGEDTPDPGTSWQSFWEQHLAPYAQSAFPDTASGEKGTDEFGNQVYYVVHRLCLSSAAPGASGRCVNSPAVTTSTGNAQEPGVQLTAASAIYYRITVRVAGPRGTESYVQTIVAM
jgi:type IV pilus assembly protein PilX